MGNKTNNNIILRRKYSKENPIITKQTSQKENPFIFDYQTLMDGQSITIPKKEWYPLIKKFFKNIKDRDYRKKGWKSVVASDNIDWFSKTIDGLNGFKYEIRLEHDKRTDDYKINIFKERHNRLVLMISDFGSNGDVISLPPKTEGVDIMNKFMGLVERWV